MTTSLVLTVIGQDKPGLVEAVSQAIAAHDGSWEASHMARLAGRFAGILLVTIDAGKSDALIRALGELEGEGLKLLVDSSAAPRAPTGDHNVMQLELVGHDHPGIIREVSAALSERAVNVVDLATEITSAPMSGDDLFKMTARLHCPTGLDIDELRDRLETLAVDLVVDIALVSGED